LNALYIPIPSVNLAPKKYLISFVNKRLAKPEIKSSSCEEAGGKYRETIIMSFPRFTFSINLGMSSGIEFPSRENGMIALPVACSNACQKDAFIPEVVWQSPRTQ